MDQIFSNLFTQLKRMEVNLKPVVKISHLLTRVGHNTKSKTKEFSTKFIIKIESVIMANGVEGLFLGRISGLFI